MRKSVLLVILILIYCFLKPTSVLAKTAPPSSIYAGYDFTISAPRFVSGDSGGEQCPVSCDYPSLCANTENLNNCNKPTCPPGGNAWTTYNLNCVLTLVDRNTSSGTCEPQYSIGAVVYSNGDKCISGGPYLNPGYCESAFGGPIYKTCCDSTGNALSPFQCVAFDADGAGDPEGRCPAGYTREVFCGAGTGVECGQPACGPVGSPKTCDYNRSYNQCCGNNLSQNVDEYTWSDGTGVCNHIVGECNQTDPACAGATPPPPTK